MDVNEFLERARVIVMLARTETNPATLAALDRSQVARDAVNLLCELLPAELTAPLGRDERLRRAFNATMVQQARSSLDGVELVGVDTDPSTTVVMALNGILRAGDRVLAVVPFVTRPGRDAFLIVRQTQAKTGESAHE